MFAPVAQIGDAAMPKPVVRAWIRGHACGYAPATFVQIRNLTMPGKIAARLVELKIELPKAAAPVANYVPVVITGNQAFVSGQVTVWNGEFQYKGQLGKDYQVEDGQKAARLCGQNIVAQLQAALGDLDRVKRCVKLNVFVNSAPGFTDQPKVANGVSDFMVEVFGDAGKHARSAVGVAQLPLGVAVEVDATFEIA
jgi:enamine deaminase RidA (YjgF/YER057c/UK114 family)